VRGRYRHGILMIATVLTGWPHRPFVRVRAASVTPDIICLKALTAGYMPMAVTVTNAVRCVSATPARRRRRPKHGKSTACGSRRQS
jgi:adenosylmethionine-8-amino-7-oxononanoate aminotransferase